MIKLSKNPDIPKALNGEKAEQLLELHRTERQNGVPELTDIKSSVYAAKPVRKQIYKDQIRKCCYCEKVIERAFNDVEHYRPKGSVRERDDHPGYWWLAYNWYNLLYSCPQCNRTGKNDKFPIPNEELRCLKPDDQLSAEAPFLLNPYFEDVEHLFSYEFSENEVRIIPSALDVDGRAEKSIEVFDLNREDLRENRNGVFETFKFIIDDLNERIASATDTQRHQIQDYLENNLLGSQQVYAGMLRHYRQIVSQQQVA